MTQKLKKIQENALFILVLLFLALSKTAFADHLLGGELTWACLGTGEYIFQVKVYQDCNQNQPPPTSMQIKVWNNPNLSVIPLTNIGNNDFSLTCTEIAGGNPQYDCSNPGAGSIIEYILQSTPITLTGVPPSNGWHFTWDAFFRTSQALNLNNAQNAGLTLHASMYSFNGQDASPCFDSSPHFIKPPLNVVCSGRTINYNIGAFDSDLDSISYAFANPLNNDFGTTYNPPISPSEVAWAQGYSTNSQLPSTTQNNANTPATLNTNTGALSFNSLTLGSYSTVVKVESWRCGQLIAVVYREMLVNIVNCSSNNTPPTISLNGISNNAITVNAGDIVTFDITAQDNDLLSNGTSQSVTLNIFGGEVGTNLTSTNTGCPFPPCATTNTGMPVTAPTTVNSTFNWETSCALFTEDCYRPQKTFYFTIYAQDDYCSLPGQTEVTFSVTVNNTPPIDAPKVHCASVSTTGAVTLNWDAPNNTNNSFQEYRIYTNNNTLITSIPNINTTNYTHTTADANNGSVSYLVKSVFGCNQSESSVIDTISTLFLTVNNPSDGTAVLQWNKMSTPALSTASNWYYIYQEYPTGVWTLIDSTEYGNEYYRDTISVCDAFINYKIELKDNSGCSSFSNIDGDQFQDMLPPNLPIFNWVTVDTATGNANLNWNPSTSEDASAYIVFQFFGGGWIAIDTIQGYNSTDYTYLNSNADEYSEIYALAVYDSCWNPTPNTSPLGVEQNTIYVTSSLDICTKTITLKWNSYKNWQDGVKQYQIEASEDGGNYQIVGNTTDTTFNFTTGTPNANYCFVVKAIANDQIKTSLSNKTCIFLHQPPVPQFNYLQTATVINDNEIEIRVHQDLQAQISNFRLERQIKQSNGNSYFDEIMQTSSTSNPVVFNDTDVDTDMQSYTYRVVADDSCGRPTLTSNIGKTILLNVRAESSTLTNFLQWNKYKQWNGNLIGYNIYRSINGVFAQQPIASLPPTQQFYNDDISNTLSTATEGEFCYYIEALESTNQYGIQEKSTSNVGCAQQEPIVYAPNAMVIGGVNNTWKPIINLIDYSSYELKIYNRFSEVIFETNDSNMAWDGGHKKNGKIVQQGLYLYLITFKKSDGKFIKVRGHISLIK